MKISEILTFKYQPLIDRLLNEGASQPEAEVLFADLKRFLWMCAQFPEQTFVPTPAIDRVWHDFLQFTRAYRDFCLRQLGRFIDHEPAEALPASFRHGVAKCASCTRGSAVDGRNGEQLASMTLARAQMVFGDLSKNWSFDDANEIEVKMTRQMS